jgi:hypothetical protein
MKRTYLLILLSSIVIFPTIQAEEFSTKEKSIIYTYSLKILENYESLINETGVNIVSDVEKAKSDAENFLELFVNRQVLIFNDIDPAHRLSEFYEAETYISNIILWYPDGITIHLDLINAKVSEIISHGENVFSLDIIVNKSINGNYLNQTLNKNTELLSFRIAFRKENKSFSNFKIVGIRDALSNYVIDYAKAVEEINSEDLNKEELLGIHNNIKSLFNDYSNYLALIGDIRESDEDKEFYKSSFLKLFQNNEIRIYNDLAPDPQTSLTNINDYLSNYVTDFPRGIKNIALNIDSAHFGNIIISGNGNYFINVNADKYFSGNYKGKETYSKMFPLIFKIAFKLSGQTLTDFRISRIDISTANFYKGTAPNVLSEKSQIITPVTRKGYWLSFYGSYIQTSINNVNIKSLSLEDNYHYWNIKPRFGYLSGIGMNLYLSNNFSIQSGVELIKYSSTYLLRGKFTDNTISYDLNASPFQKIVDADLDSLVSFNEICLPVLFNCQSGKPGKIGLFFQFGTKISLTQNAHFVINGIYKYSGYYPSHPEVTQYLDLNELGFYSKDFNNKTSKLGLNQINISLCSSFGIAIPIGYYTSLNIGPEVFYGLTDLLKNENLYTDIFGKAYNHKPTKTFGWGFQFALKYKL